VGLNKPLAFIVKILLVGTMLSMGVACSDSSTDPSPETAKAKELVVESGSAEGAAQAAQAAMAQGDMSLYVILGRQTNIPGASSVPHSADELEAHCGFKPIAHADVFENQEQLASLKDKTTYAVSYNKAILPDCIKKIEANKP
jgi:hypothetical protein